MKIIISLILAFPPTYLANDLKGDADRGKKVYKKVGCTICHKKDGMGKAKIVKGKLKLKILSGPRIAGLNEEYIYKEMIAIQGKNKKNIRKTKYTNTMKIKIKKLTHQEIKDVAAYVSKKLNPLAGSHIGIYEKSSSKNSSK